MGWTLPSIVTVPLALSMRWSRHRCSSPYSGCRRQSWPSSLNWMIAIAFCIRAMRSGSRSLALHGEALGGVVAVDGAGQLLRGRHGDPVALLELGEAAVAERDP